MSATNVARAGKRGNICVGNNVSATMCPRLPVPLDYVELGHFTLLFFRGRQRNVQRFITHAHACKDIVLLIEPLFGDVLVVDVVVVLPVRGLLKHDGNSNENVTKQKV